MIVLSNNFIPIQLRIAHDRDESAYKQLFLNFHKPLLQFAFSILKNKELSEEVVSDVMMNLWNLEDRLAEVKDLKVYLYRAIRNTCINYLKKQRSSKSWDIEAVDVLLFYNEETPETLLIDRELHKKITFLIKQLPPKTQMVYKLVKEDRMTYKEVAEIMSITVNTVDAHLYKAVNKLLTALKIYNK